MLLLLVMNVCKCSAESKGDGHFNVLPKCCLLKAPHSVESSIFKKIFGLENYTRMQRNIKPPMSLKALQELQRMASSQAGAKVCANVFKENDILSKTLPDTSCHITYLYLIHYFYKWIVRINKQFTFVFAHC